MKMDKLISNRGINSIFQDKIDKGQCNLISNDPETTVDISVRRLVFYVYTSITITIEWCAQYV